MAPSSETGVWRAARAVLPGDQEASTFCAWLEATWGWLPRQSVRELAYASARSKVTLSARLEAQLRDGAAVLDCLHLRSRGRHVRTTDLESKTWKELDRAGQSRAWKRGRANLDASAESARAGKVRREHVIWEVQREILRLRGDVLTFSAERAANTLGVRLVSEVFRYLRMPVVAPREIAKVLKRLRLHAQRLKASGLSPAAGLSTFTVPVWGPEPPEPLRVVPGDVLGPAWTPAGGMR